MKFKVLTAAAALALATACAATGKDDVVGGATSPPASSPSMGASAPAAGADTGATSGGGSGAMGSMGMGSMGMGTMGPGAMEKGAMGMGPMGMGPMDRGAIPPDNPVAGAAASGDRDIVATAQGAAQFTTLVSAIQAAGLVDTLKGPGPYTVFAPTDAAFRAMPAGMLDQLMQPANKGRLVAVLTYHVVPGKLTSADLRPGQSLTTVQGGKLTVTAATTTTGAKGSKAASGGATTAATLKVNGATIVGPDTAASNGMVHAIDKVLVPAAKPS